MSFSTKIRGIVNIIIETFSSPLTHSTLLLDGPPSEPAGPGTQPRSPSAPAELTPAFKLVFIGALVLTLISIGVAIWVASVDDPTAQQASLYDTCSTTWKMGFGGILGLLGGKAT